MKNKNNTFAFRIELMPIEAVNLNPCNPRTIKDEAFKRLVKSLADCPALFDARPCICSDRTGELVILGGNMRLRAAQELKYKKVPVIVMSGLTPEQEREIAIKDNGDFGEWNFEALANNWSDLPLIDWGVDLPLDWLKGSEDPKDAEPQIDRAEELNKTWQVKTGDIWQIGEHRLLCGDSTKAEDVARVMDGKKAEILFADPPYGIAVVGKTGSIGGDSKNVKVNKYRPVIGDDKIFSPAHLFHLADSLIIWGANYFCINLPTVGQWIVWDKNRGDGTSFSECELAWTNGGGKVIKKYKCTWDGMRREGESGERYHPTQKPVKLYVDILGDYRGDSIIDPYMGSGTTMVAAENLKRICYGIEIDPNYCAVILQRMTDAFPGIEIKRIEESDSIAFHKSEIKQA
jgi:16S rRNA G966 N2-methylase RsmD